MEKDKIFDFRFYINCPLVITTITVFHIPSFSCLHVSFGATSGKLTNVLEYHKVIQPYSKWHGTSSPWEMNYNWFCTTDGILTLHLLLGDYCKVDTKYICCLALHLAGPGFPWASHAALVVPKLRCHGGSPAPVVLPPPHAQPLPICFSLHPLPALGVQLSSWFFFLAQIVSSSRRISLRLCGLCKMKYLQQPVCG